MSYSTLRANGVKMQLEIEKLTTKAYKSQIKIIIQKSEGDLPWGHEGE